ncbi:hypothetical protein HDU93_004390, partial [Gonapodya sp. JEL0774]
WSSYLRNLADQLSSSRAVASGTAPGAGDYVPEVGLNLNRTHLDQMSDQQVGQLWALKQEAEKVGKEGQGEA